MNKYSFDLVVRTHGAEQWNAFLALIAELPPVSEVGPWLCGGAVRRLIAGQELDSDFDYFFADLKQVEGFEEWMKTNGGVIERRSDFNKTWRVKGRTVQQITIRYYTSIDDVLNSFDFTICQFGYDSQQITVGQFSLWDLARKRIALHQLTYGVSTLRRLMKYSRQGFTVCGGVLADILQRTVEAPDTINASVVSVD